MNRRRVLIETSWNVKTIVLTLSHKKTSINRNIVECKVSCQLIGTGLLSVLIETSWNVKSHPPNWLIGAQNSINRNIVECKGFLANYTNIITASINRNIVECKGACQSDPAYARRPY